MNHLKSLASWKKKETSSGKVGAWKKEFEKFPELEEMFSAWVKESIANSKVEFPKKLEIIYIKIYYQAQLKQVSLTELS